MSILEDLFDLFGSESPINGSPLQEERNKMKKLEKVLNGETDTGNNLLDSFVDNVIRDTVIAVPGCIVKCDLIGGKIEHSGIYIGNKQIVELSGEGDVRIVSPETFIGGSIYRTAISVYVACDKNKNVLYHHRIAERARNYVGKSRDYNILLDNCHQFTSGCITGNFENGDNFFKHLCSRIRSDLNNDKLIDWRVWDYTKG